MRLLHCFAAATLLAVATLTGCGGASGDDTGGGDEDAQQASTNAVTVSAREFSLEANQQTVKAGKVNLTLHNRGSIEHELIVVRTDLAPDKLPVKDGKADVPESEIIVHVHDVRAGARRSVSLELARGAYALICNIPAHYQSGMYLALTVD
ncbi:MAG: hypothetical protein EXR63_00485 [Dehalococcoidia bacterium]|nr:hypothetical protein [Dehalococcoidia bacterium]